MAGFVAEMDGPVQLLLLYWLQVPFGLGDESEKTHRHVVVRQQVVVHRSERLFEEPLQD